MSVHPPWTSGHLGLLVAGLLSACASAAAPPTASPDGSDIQHLAFAVCRTTGDYAFETSNNPDVAEALAISKCEAAVASLAGKMKQGMTGRKTYGACCTSARRVSSEGRDQQRSYACLAFARAPLNGGVNGSSAGTSTNNRAEAEARAKAQAMRYCEIHGSGCAVVATECVPK